MEVPKITKVRMCRTTLFATNWSEVILITNSPLSKLHIVVAAVVIVSIDPIATANGVQRRNILLRVTKRSPGSISDESHRLTYGEEVVPKMSRHHTHTVRRLRRSCTSRRCFRRCGCCCLLPSSKQFQYALQVSSPIVI